MPLSKEQIEIERVNFEKWHKEVHHYDSIVKDDGKYSIPHVERRWIIWLACRESIEITLFDKREIIKGHEEYWHGQNEMLALCCAEITNQGFKVKS